MKITSERIYDVDITIEERDVLASAIKVLDDITSCMYQNKCENLECGYPDNPEYITCDDIDKAVEVIKNVAMMRQMF